MCAAALCGAAANRLIPIIFGFLATELSDVSWGDDVLFKRVANPVLDETSHNTRLTFPVRAKLRQVFKVGMIYRREPAFGFWVGRHSGRTLTWFGGQLADKKLE